MTKLDPIPSTLNYPCPFLLLVPSKELAQVQRGPFGEQETHGEGRGHNFPYSPNLLICSCPHAPHSFLAWLHWWMENWIQLLDCPNLQHNAECAGLTGAYTPAFPQNINTQTTLSGPMPITIPMSKPVTDVQNLPVQHFLLCLPALLDKQGKYMEFLKCALLFRGTGLHDYGVPFFPQEKKSGCANYCAQQQRAGAQ